MKLYDVTECEWAKEVGQTTTLEQKGLEQSVLDMLNYCSEEMGEDEDEFKLENYKLIDKYLVYRDGEVHILDGYNDVISVFTPEFGELFFSHAFKCASGQAILVFYKSLEDAGECENQILMSL